VVVFILTMSIFETIFGTIFAKMSDYKQLKLNLFEEDTKVESSEQVRLFLLSNF